MNPLPSRCAPWLAVCLTLFVTLALPADEKPVDTRPLLAIRPLGKGLTAKADKPRFPKLADYYFEANPRLRARLDELKKTFENGEKGYSFTFLSAPAGAGKSFLFGSFTKEMAPHLYTVDLTKMDPKRMPMRLVTDLHPLGVEDPARSTRMRAFGKMSDPPRVQNCPPLTELFKALGHDLAEKPRPFLLIDSLDEVHPLSSLSVLERVDEHLKQAEQRKPDGFQHIFVFGRPESFKMFYRDRHPERTPALSPMKLPDYRTLADLKVGLESSRVYHKLAEKDVDAALALIPKHHFLDESVMFLNVQGDLLSKAREFDDGAATDRQIKNVLLGRMLERNAKVMNRPRIEDDWYMQLLECIAASWTTVDADGYFPLDWKDTIEIRYMMKEELLKRIFNVSTTLNRSGVVLLDGNNFAKPRYRFVPSWVHEHLVWRHNQRLAGK